MSARSIDAKEGGFMMSSSIRTVIVAVGAFFTGGGVTLAQETTRVSVSSAGEEGNYNSFRSTISADGRFVAFASDATNLVASDTNGFVDVFVHDRSTGVTERVSLDPSGAQANGDSRPRSITSDGRYVAFESNASNLVLDDTNRVDDVFVHDRSTGITERVSVDSSGAEGNSSSTLPWISDDGRLVSFQSYAWNLVAGDTNEAWDIFVHDRVSGSTERVSVDSSGAEANGSSYVPVISANRRIVAFDSDATNLVAGETSGWDIYVHDRITGVTERVSVDSSGVQGNGISYYASLSEDGRFVAFESGASNLVGDDTNGTWDVFVHDRETGVTERVSVNPAGMEGNAPSGVPSISADGRFVAFLSDATNLVAYPTRGKGDVFVHDRSTRRTELVSFDSTGIAGSEGCRLEEGTISGDGHSVAFESYSSNLVAGDTNDDNDVFVHDRGPLPAVRSNYGSGLAGTNGVASFTALADPVLGTTFTLDLANSYDDYTVGALFFGFEQAALHSSWEGDLLVVPFTTLLVGLSPWGASIIGDIPDDEFLAGLELDLQVFELDPGAVKGVSMTQGLQLILGH